ncbi:hypothetical protein [Sphingomonas morindae]|uniref:STAS/SEC14 domain-containing protein n=1 Tax=Sphingomonas morindae TaxID=1541170 RepID=A0ABY4X6S1_9SPHN|nr:hypothetical protein [Sphingomonas morindae]USI72581.1 hypothetical protein LHA26_15030 [Sphingomonas morindae]
MVSGWYRIEVERAQDLVRLTLGGFFEEAEIRALSVEFLAATRQLACGPNRHLTLCDIRGLNIQGQDIVAAFGQFVGNPTVRSRRLALVTAPSLARLQAKRLTQARDDVAFFDEESRAMAWLLGA